MLRQGAWGYRDMPVSHLISVRLPCILHTLACRFKPTGIAGPAGIDVETNGCYKLHFRSLNVEALQKCLGKFKRCTALLIC